tara:strand:+ start:126 stop:314 length:189 start_codon:yes stop_codon:yes gene_type:complete
MSATLKVPKAIRTNETAKPNKTLKLVSTNFQMNFKVSKKRGSNLRLYVMKTLHQIVYLRVSM